MTSLAIRPVRSHMCIRNEHRSRSLPRIIHDHFIEICIIRLSLRRY